MASTQGIRAGKAFVELFADNTKLVQGLRAAEFKVRAFGASVKNMGMQMFKMGAAMMSPIIASAKVFGDFEKNIKMVSTMLNEPMKFMSAFGSGIRDMAMDFGESTSTLAKGLYEVISASVNPARAMSVLGVASKSAIGGITDTATTVKGLVAVLNSFQLSADQSKNVADLMFQTVKRGTVTFEELVQQIGKVAPMARAANMPIQDMFAALATLTRQGLDADEATTRLVNILKQAPSEAKSFASLIQRYIGSDLAAIQLDFPEIRAAGGIATLSGDFQGLLTDMALMRNATGVSDEAFNTMNSGLISDFNKIWAIIKDIGISVGEALAPEIKKLAEWMKTGGRDVSDWISKNQGLVVSYTKIAIGITGLGIALVALGTIATSAAAVIGVLASAFGLLLTPIGLAAMGIAFLGGMIIKYTDAGGQAIQWLGGQFDFLRQDAENAFNGIADALAAGSIAQAAKILWLTLKMEWLRGTNFLQNMWITTTGFMAEAAIGAFTVIATTFNIVASGIKAAWIETASAFSWAWNDAIDGVAQKLLWWRSLIDKSFDFDAAYASIDQDAEARNAQRKADDEKRLADIGAEFNKKLDDYGKWNVELRANIDEGVNADLDANTKQLLAAQQEWRDAIGQARSMREQRENWRPGDAPPAETLPQIAPMENAIMDLGDIPEMIKAATVSTRGTFSAFAAYGLGVGSGVEERTVKAAEATAKNTRDMLKEMRDNQLEFA